MNTIYEFGCLHKVQYIPEKKRKHPNCNANIYWAIMKMHNNLLYLIEKINFLVIYDLRTMKKIFDRQVYKYEILDLVITNDLLVFDLLVLDSEYEFLWFELK